MKELRIVLLVASLSTNVIQAIGASDVDNIVEAIQDVRRAIEQKDCR